MMVAFLKNPLGENVQNNIGHFIQMFLEFLIAAKKSRCNFIEMRSCIFSDFSGKHANSGEIVSGPTGIVAKSFGSGPNF